MLKFLDKREIDIVRKLSSNRGDDAGLDLRKRGVMKIMAWVAEKSLKKHLGFFLSYLDATENVKKYLMKQDGKELYNELIKGFKPVLTIEK